MHARVSASTTERTTQRQALCAPPAGQKDTGIERGKPQVRGSLFGAACISFQPVLLNLLSVPATVYIIRTMGPTGYGQWATAFALINAFGLFTNLGLRGSFVRAISKDPDSAPRVTAEQLGLRLLLGCAAALVGVAAAFVLAYPPVVLSCAAIASLTLVLGAFLSTSSDLLQAFGGLPRLATVNFIAGLVLTLASALVVWFRMGPLALMASYLTGPAISVALLLFTIQARHFPVRVSWSFRRFWVHIQQSRFFAAQSWLLTVSAAAEAMLVPKLVGVNQFSFFYAGVMVPDRLSVVPDGLGTALYPVVSRSFHEDRRQASRDVTRFLTFGLLVCLPLVLVTLFSADGFSRLLFPTSPDLCRQVLWITIFALPVLTLDHIMGYSLNAAGQEAAQARSVLISGVCSLVASVLLITYLGLVGACLSWVFRSALRAGIRFPSFIRTFRLRVAEIPLVRTVLCSLFMASALRYAVPAMAGLPGLGRILAGTNSTCVLIVLVLQGTVGLAVYATALLALRVLKPRDIRLLRRRPA